MEDVNPVQPSLFSSSLYLGTHVLASRQYNHCMNPQSKSPIYLKRLMPSTPDDELRRNRFFALSMEN